MEVILYLDRSRAKRRVNAPSTYVINGEIIKIKSRDKNAENINSVYT